MGNEDLAGRRPLVIGIGGVGCSIASGLTPGDFDIACIDTDMRTAHRIPDAHIIGGDMVQGEGCGGNMTLGKAVFKRSLDFLRDIISDHSPVFTISSMGGGTGIPGAVEVNQLLRSSMIPCFNFITLEDLGEGGSSHSRALANVFLGGPLCPGSMIIMDPAGDREDRGADVATRKQLGTAVEHIANSSSQAANIVTPGAVWHIFARELRPFSISLMDLDSIEKIGDIDPSALKSGEGQTLMVLEIPVNISNAETEMIMGSIDGESPDTHLGLIENPDRKGGFTVLSIGLSGEKPGVINDQNLSHISREYVEELMNEGYGMSLDRSGKLL